MLIFSQAVTEDAPELQSSVKHNHVGTPYSIKLVYPAFYHEICAGHEEFKVGFPKFKRKLAKKVESGHLFFVYVTSPEKWIIGLGRVVDPARELEGEHKRPYQVSLKWVVGPKSVGVKFTDADLIIKPRIGDSLYALEMKDALRIIERLRKLPDATSEDLEKRAQLYKI